MTKRTSLVGSPSGFTLVEVLVACAVLIIVVGILSQVVQLSGQAILENSGKLDAAGQARVFFDRLAADLAGRPARSDLGLVVTKSSGGGNSDTLQFYSEVGGYNGTRRVTSIGYQVETQPTLFQLERGATGTSWIGGNPLVFLQTPPSPNIESPTPAAATDYEVLAIGVFRLEICYLLKTGALSDSNQEASSTDLSQVSALIVGVAVLDNNTRKLLVASPTSTSTKGLQELASDLPVCAEGRDPLSTWNSALSSASFGADLPRPVIENLRLYQRAFRLF
jgi:type II secretory pathway pseudopilin PulG